MNTITLSIKNITAKPLQTLLSILLFALSIGLITFLLLFNHQVKNGLDRNLASIDLIIGAKGSPLQLVLNSMYHIDAPTGNIPVADAAPFLNPMHPLIASSIPLSLGDSYGAFRIVGAPQTIMTLYQAKRINGAIYREDFEAVIGSVVADKLHLHVGDHFQSTHGLLDDPDLSHDHGIPFTVTGILESTGSVLDQLILCSPATIWKIHSHETTPADSLHEDHAHGDDDHAHTDDTHAHGNEDHAHVHTTDWQQLDSAAIALLGAQVMEALRQQPEQEITSMLIKFRNRTSIQSLNFLRNINVNTSMMAASPALELNRLYSMLGSSTEAIRYIAILIAIVAAISIFISLYTSLRERQYEMALLRVTGASPMTLFKLIVFEGVLIAIAGAILGLSLGHLGMSVAGGILRETYKYNFSGWIWLPAEFYILIIAVSIGIVASLLPAMRGAAIDLHKTLAEG